MRILYKTRPITINDKRINEILHESIKKYNVPNIDKFDGITCEINSNQNIVKE